MWAVPFSIVRRLDHYICYGDIEGFTELDWNQIGPDVADNFEIVRNANRYETILG